MEIKLNMGKETINFLYSCKRYKFDKKRDAIKIKLLYLVGSGGKILSYGLFMIQCVSWALEGWVCCDVIRIPERVPMYPTLVLATLLYTVTLSTLQNMNVR